MSAIAASPVRSRAPRLPSVRIREGSPLRSPLRPLGRQDRARESARQAAAHERARILRDLHDGCGGQLLAALQLAQNGAPAVRIAAALRDCIDDLRITLDGLDGLTVDLAPMLAAQRDRMEARLEELPLRLDWDFDLSADLTPTGADHGLHVLRIVQEAFTNVLKHAQASLIRVEGRIESEPLRQLRLRIRDDGIGLRRGHGGRGLLNMRRRADMMGAALDVRILDASDGGGTEVELRVPLRMP